MARLMRSFVLPLSGGLVGGAISFGIFLVVATAYFDLLYRFQILVSGILAIVASLVVLFGVYARISHDRRAEENKLKRDAFAFATVLLSETSKFQSRMDSIYSRCASSAQQGRHRLALKQLADDMRDINLPDTFEASWRDMGLLNPDVTLLIHSTTRGIELARTWILSHPWLEEQPVALGILSPIQDILKETAVKEEDRRLNIIATFVDVQIDHYEGMIKPPLQTLMIYLEAEAEEYATQLGLDEKRQWLRAQAKARRDARRQSGRSEDPW